MLEIAIYRRRKANIFKEDRYQVIEAIWNILVTDNEIHGILTEQ